MIPSPGNRNLQFVSATHQGFTLVEVMVALTILSMVMLATITGLRTLASSQVAIERMTSRVDEVRTVSSFLRDTLESAVSGANASRLSLGGGGQEKLFFEASKQSLAWKSTVLFGEGFGGSYLVRVGREGEKLVLRWLEPPKRGALPGWGEAPTRTLIEDLQEFRLSFRHEYSESWSDSPGRDGVPALVRMQIRADGRSWPDLILRIQGSR